MHAHADVRVGLGAVMSFAVVSSLSSHTPDLMTLFAERHDGYVQEEASVRLLLTSAGVTNPSIRDALVDLLGRPVVDSSALCIPTAQYGHPCAGRSRPGVSSPARRHYPCATWGGSRWASWS